MRKIVHISDVHFGQADAEVVAKLTTAILTISPDLLVVSGDLTQRARSAQFREAREFLGKFPMPQIVVPGNHDVPLYNVFDRFVNPLEKYKRFITDDLLPFYSDDEIAVIGINTARSLTIKGGRINEEQIAAVNERLRNINDQVLKIVVSHHPFDLPEGLDEDDIVENAEEAMESISQSGADVFLSGHLHVSHIVNSARRYKLQNGRAALIIQAGTAASVRVRGERNSFNLIETQFPELTVTRFECEPANSQFAALISDHFKRSEKGWSRTVKA
jgi:3',5'-cyclic AMP phosphodiesterase CpdA